MSQRSLSQVCKILIALAIVAATMVPARANDVALFVNSDNSGAGAGHGSAAVVINITFGNSHTASISTATGFQYNGADSDGTCPATGSCFFNQGWYSSGTGVGAAVISGTANTNYVAGALGQNNYRDFFSFDTHSLLAADLASGISSAQFVVTLFDKSGTGPVKFVLSQTTQSSADFNNNTHDGLNINNPLYNDLADGLSNPAMLLGSSTLVLPSGATQLTVDLNSQAFALIDGAYLHTPGGDNQVFTIGGSLVEERQAVPEPASVLLLAAGALTLLRRRRRG